MSDAVFPHIILASTSPYRRELLQRLRIPFETISPQVNETPFADEQPRQLARRLAEAKARAVAELHPDAVVIGSDQVADLHGKSLGKPLQHDRAVTQLRAMRGQTVVFHTAVAVVCLARQHTEVDVAQVSVTFRDVDTGMSDEEIESYLRLEQPYDCAGSAKSEGLGIALLARIQNDDPTALIGLPMIKTCSMLRAAGVPLLTGARA
ncbi:MULTISPECIES: Maf family protein [Brachymonas]|uniref:Maf family protein n=1 Tax=Brachymonas TaxID=28219 RepID=UPI002E78D9F9|nr:Maf family nucleotide pyrophosphatase [Brachymonas sp. J145]MEE1653013.1 Maf family nucleotide pyrophosphatase [Brachymonas sp. J145]